MIERIEGLPVGVVGLRATGEVTREDYELVVVPLFDAMRAKGEPIRLLFHFPEQFHSFTAGAAWEDAKVGLRNLRLLERCAVVSDKTWLRTATRAMGLVVPTRMRTYDEDDLDEAIEWLDARGEGSSLTYRAFYELGVLVLEPHDELHVEDIDRIATLVDPWIEEGDLAGVVVHAPRFPGWEDLAGMIEHLKFVRDHHRKVARVAFAVDGPMAKLGESLARHFVRAEVRRFDFDEVEEAIDWAAGEGLGAEPDLEGVDLGQPVST